MKPILGQGLQFFWHTNHVLLKILNFLQNIWLLFARLYVAQIFFKSGLTKIENWSNTLALFADEYQVPVLSPEVAAFAGTTGELVLPVLLVIGLGGRFAALGLLVVNTIAVISLPDIAPAALERHYLWGALLITLALVGLGRWSIDTFLQRYVQYKINSVNNIVNIVD